MGFIKIVGNSQRLKLLSITCCYKYLSIDNKLRLNYALTLSATLNGGNILIIMRTTDTGMK